MQSSTTFPDTTPRPSRAMLASIAILSFAVLGFEVALTRLFSVLLRYHFAFLVISIALCGLGVGGYLAHALRNKVKLSLPILAQGFALGILAALALMLRVIFPFYPEAFWLVALAMLVPFSLAGLFLAEAFARYSQDGGRLYAWDLVGAGLAALTIVGVMQVVSAVDACLVMAIVAALAGLVAIERDASTRLEKPFAFVAAAILLGALFSNGSLRWLDIQPIPPKIRFDLEMGGRVSLADRGITQPLFTELGTEGHTSKIIDTRWNAFARTDVVEEAQDPDTLLVYTNGNVPTNMLRWNGDLNSVKEELQFYRLIDWTFAAAPLGKQRALLGEKPQARAGRVLSIGPGGGLDALMALYYGAEKFEGAEINPSIVGLMKDYRKFNGGIYERPDVHVETAEGRAYVREAQREGKKYSLIFSALTKTATAAQGTALLESYIYTQDAFRDYWNALDEHGQMVQVCDQPFLLARLYATTIAMLSTQGLNEIEANKRIALVADPQPNGPYVYALVLQKSPLTEKQTFAMSNNALERSLSMIWLPGREAKDTIGPISAIAQGQMSLDDYIATWRNPPGTNARPIDISPCSDDRPFVLDITLGVLPEMWRLAGFAALMALGLGALAWRSRGNESSRVLESSALPQAEALPRWVPLLYFALLGVGFMLVEIPLAQKLILPLGYPTLSLTTILFSVLIGGGIGAWFSQRYPEGEPLAKWAATCALGVAIFTALSTVILPLVGEALLSLPLLVRCIVVGLMLLPVGFLLGTPFPSGMRLVASATRVNIPLIWGVNGVTSVVGSLCAAMFAKFWGFSGVLLLGAACYVVASGLLLRYFVPQKENETALQDE